MLCFRTFGLRESESFRERVLSPSAEAALAEVDALLARRTSVDNNRIRPWASIYGLMPYCSDDEEPPMMPPAGADDQSGRGGPPPSDAFALWLGFFSDNQPRTPDTATVAGCVAGQPAWR